MGNLNDEILSILEITVPRGIKIRWNRPNEDIFLKGNSIKFQQVLMNLYINAVQAMGEVGKLKISMCKQQQEGRSTIRIDIEDNGPGMDKKTLEKIFDPLFTTKETEQGTGLGLFVVKHIIDEYRGGIEVESKIGRGTVFRVYFPLE
jgi:signal transduction histidine kinase